MSGPPPGPSALLEGQSTRKAVRFAVAASAIAVTKFGAQPSYPTRAELKEFMPHSESA